MVVIGTSAGGVDALRRLVANLPAGLPASVVIAMHSRAPAGFKLPETLARYGPLPAAHAVNGQRLTHGLLTVAPPGQHLVVTAGDVLQLHRGPPVHRTRPAVDPLFESAAHACGSRVIAVVLSGLLYDGAEGAAAVAAAGGTVLVQDPVDAQHAAMPRAALARTPQAVSWPAGKLGTVIADLVADRSDPQTEPRDRPEPTAETDAALRMAVDRLHAHAAAQERMQRRLGDDSPLFARTQAETARTMRAAELITTRVLPMFRRDPG
ncbi:chemotaxis protein CheB [Amycolatopsis sp., V23-08]|uniref:protein-glutamate methylesterase n=1 Tax=Amycolatopsis heterodermiae TaxID=3110235 RepID=A0ABU5R5Q7_9PSEU|nr:chemotaxis protein CheB [Amycolatopsis sp., V23-08]MEA5360999.1 chemotaxis protein CheB [Amycolatopsis sp., V23-08]